MSRLMLSQEDIIKECEKCKNDPYYFATTYLTVYDSNNKQVPFKTNLSRTNFNDMFKEKVI